MTDHEHVPLNVRTVGYVYPSDDVTVTVEHVYTPGAAPCDGCGTESCDPGFVGMAIHRDGEQPATATMGAEEALLLANRLTRAANLVLELGEDVPDIERDVARFAPEGSPQ